MDRTTLIVEQAVFTTVPLVFGALHLLFFLFDPRRREHLYFSILTVCFAGAAHFEYQQDLLLYEPSRRWGLLLIFGIMLSGVRLVQERLYERTPRRFWWFLAAAVAASVWLLFDTGAWLLLISLFLAAFLVEIGWMAPRLVRASDSSAWVLVFGFLTLTLGGVLDVLIDLGFMTDVLGTTNPWLYGAMFLLLTISLHLAHDFARVNRELEERLGEVERLSEERLRQERTAREQEVARRLLELENARKSEELEAARRLQLAMLPARLPTSDAFELAALTETATEVGGDYYDAHLHADGALTLALGDAVGHGARAGTLVAISKGLFHLVAEEDGDLGRALGRFNHALLQTGLERASMAMTLARLREGRLTIAAAGIPPALLVRAGTDEVEEIPASGLPLGSSALGRYRQVAVELGPGDTLLFTTDGLAEAADGEGEPFGYERAAELFLRVAAEPVDRIPRRLAAAVRQWTGTERPADDVTALVLRAR